MDTKTINTSLNIGRIAIAVIGMIVCILIMKNSDAILIDRHGSESNYVDTGLILMYVVMILCAAAAIIYGIVYFAKHFKQSKGAMFGLIGFSAILLVSWLLSSGSIPPGISPENLTENVSRLSGMGLYAVYIIFLIAVGVTVYTEVNKLFK